MELSKDQRSEVFKMYYFFHRLVQENYADFMTSGLTEEEMLRFMDLISSTIDGFMYETGIKDIDDDL